MKIAIGSDHAGFRLKNELLEILSQKGYEILNCGTFDEISCDYPDYAKIVCEEVKSKTVDFGILCCGTGCGMSLAANKIKGIRAVLSNEHFTVKMARAHNDANVCCFGQWTIGAHFAAEIAEIFVNTPFERDRHERRVEKINALEN